MRMNVRRPSPYGARYRLVLALGTGERRRSVVLLELFDMHPAVNRPDPREQIDDGVIAPWRRFVENEAAAIVVDTGGQCSRFRPHLRSSVRDHLERKRSGRQSGMEAFGDPIRGLVGFD